MAITPMQARSSVRQQLTEEEKGQANELERKLDQKLSQLFGADPSSISISFGLDDTPGDSVPPAVVAELIERYKNVGWREIIIHPPNPNFAIQFTW
jgi:hypothetical protein